MAFFSISCGYPEIKRRAMLNLISMNEIMGVILKGRECSAMIRLVKLDEHFLSEVCFRPAVQTEVLSPKWYRVCRPES